MRIRPYCFQGLCFHLCIFVLHLYTFYQYTYLLFFSDLSTVVRFLSIVFANSDLGLMLLMLANANWVFEGRGGVFISSIAYSVSSSCILMVYGGLSLSLCVLVTCIDLGWLILFIGNLSLSVDDLDQYFRVTSSLLSFSGGRLHSTSRTFAWSCFVCSR